MSPLDPLRDRLLRLVERQVPGAREVRLEGLRQLAGGNARTAWSFDLKWVDAGTRSTRQCVLLMRAEAGQLERELAPEFAVLRALEGRGVPIPRALWCDAEGDVLGSPGFVMERVAGETSLRSLLDPGESTRNHALGLALAEATATLHRVDWRETHLGGSDPPSAENAGRAQVAVWEAVYRTHRMEPMPALHYAFRWLDAHAPIAGRVSVIHGDLRFGNIVYEGSALRALLDWEMSHLGDPCEDLAWVYRSLWSPEAALPFDTFLRHYHASGGPPFEQDNLVFHQLLAEVKHAVISLTGAHAFAVGGTRNLRLADRMSWVPECLETFYRICPEIEGYLA